MGTRIPPGYHQALFRPKAIDYYVKRDLTLA